MPKKHLAILGIKYYPSKGGTSRVVENLLSELNHEYDITIYCYENEQADGYMEGVTPIQIPPSNIKGFGVFLYYYKCFKHVLNHGNYDLVHVHKTDASFFIPMIQHKFKVIATSHALPQLNEKWSFIGRMYFKAVERIFMKIKGTVTTISKPLSEYYTKKYNRPVKFIPNGIHLPQTPTEAEIIDVKAKFGIEGDYILFAARRVIPLKGAHHMIKALHQIDYQGNVVIAGDIDQMPAYTKELRVSGEGLNIQFIGYVSGMKLLNALVHQADLFVFPSEIEGMSMMLLEVSSLGTPIVCSDIDPNKAVLDPNEALFFESKNAHDLADKLKWAFENPASMEKMAIAGRAKVEELYTMKSVGQQYKELYTQVLEE